MADEYTDITNNEQFSFCIRHPVDDNLEVKEDFLDFCALKNIKSGEVANAIKDILLTFNLGASNMIGKMSGVATKLLVEQPKALVTYC